MPKPKPQTKHALAPLPTAKLARREKLACLRLIRSENVGPVTFRALINHYGGAQKALDALPELSRKGGRTKPIRICSADLAEQDLAAAEAAGAEVIFTIEPGYPALLANVDVPPPLIYAKGRLELLNRPAIAIVGSRMCSAAGAKLSAQFAGALSEAGYVIVSGFARGIDSFAHEASLRLGTIAVMAGGLDIIYPPENAGLYERLPSQGCMVSEQPPGFKARGPDFPRRNRIISGLSFGVVIVEAAARSGTLVTARFAADQGRHVFAVPGHPLDPRAEGTNALIKRGATFVTTPEDVIEALRPLTGLSETDASKLAIADELPEAAACVIEDFGMSERDRVLTALGPAPVDLDTLVRATGLPQRVVSIALVEFDLAGRITRPGPGLIALKSD